MHTHVWITRNRIHTWIGIQSIGEHSVNSTRISPYRRDVDCSSLVESDSCHNDFWVFGVQRRFTTVTPYSSGYST